MLRPGPGRNAQDHLVAGRMATIERIYVDYDGDVHLGVTVDDVPGQDMMRDIGRYLFFKPDEVEVPADPRSRSRSSSPASATRGCRTTASAPRSPSGWRRASCRPGVTVMDFGTGGLDLAYEIMRGYHALVLVDVSRQGGEPGTLYVLEPDPEDVRARSRTAR